MRLAPGRTPTEEPRRSFAAFPTPALGVEGEEGEEAACMLLSGLPMDHARVNPHLLQGLPILVSPHHLHISRIPDTAFAKSDMCAT